METLISHVGIDVIPNSFIHIGSIKSEADSKVPGSHYIQDGLATSASCA